LEADQNESLRFMAVVGVCFLVLAPTPTPKPAEQVLGLISGSSEGISTKRPAELSGQPVDSASLSTRLSCHGCLNTNLSFLNLADLVDILSTKYVMPDPKSREAAVLQYYLF